MLLRSALIALLLWAAPVLAQTAADSDAAKPESAEVPGGVDEITVTGARNDITNVQNEAHAVTAFSMQELDRANIVTVDQLAFNVPALHVGQLGAESIITLRGIGTENATITGEPGLAFHVDGVNYARPSAARVAFFDLEGVEVLRGPQGSEGGKNTTAGAIRAITRKPHGEFELQSDFQWGSYDQQRWRAALNYPINEYVQTRFAVFREDRDGFQRNLLLNDDDRDAFDADDLGFRGHLRLLPLESLDVLLTYNYYEAKGVGPVEEIVPTPLSVQCPAGFGRPAVTSRLPSFAVCGAETATDGPATSRTHELYLNQVGGQENRFWGWTSAVDWEPPELPLLGDTELKNILAYQVADLDQFRDADSTDINLFFGSSASVTKQWSEELQWSGDFGERWDWQLSGFFMRETSESELDFLIRIGILQNIDINQKTQNTSYGLGLTTTLAVADNVALKLGARYVKDQKRTQLLRDNPPQGLNAFGGFKLADCQGGATDLVGMLGPDGVQRADGIPDAGILWCEQGFRHVTGDATLEWWAAENSMLYGKIASGFKAGGFAAYEFGSYKPEKLWSFALGSKNEFFDGRLVLNAESFFYHYRDLQLVLVDGLSVRTDNADAEIFGVDLEFDAEPIQGLRLNGNGSYLDTEYTDYIAVDPVEARVSALCKLEAKNPQVQQPGCIFTDWSGNELSRAPEWSFSLGAEYQIFLGRFGSVTPRVQYYWQDDTWYRPFNRSWEDSSNKANDLQESYHQTDFKLIWTSPSESWTVEAFVTNTEDDAVFQNVLVGSAILDSPLQAWYGPPRQYGFRVGARY